MSSPASQNGAATAWPGTAASNIRDLLKGIRLTGHKDAAAARPLRTPYSLQVLQSGATSLTKGWTTLVAGTGGVTALIALITGVWVHLGNDDIRIAVVASAAAVLSAVVIAIAIIVRSDVSARAAAGAARHQAEGKIVSAVLDNYDNFWWPGYFVRKQDGTYLPVSKFNYTVDGHGSPQWVITTRTGDTLMGSQINGIVSTEDLMRNM